MDVSVGRGTPIILCLLWVTLILCGVSPVLSAVEMPTEPSLVDYQNWAYEYHPRLASARAMVEATAQNTTEAGALPDLKLAWGEMIVPVETRVGPQQRVFSVSQSLPWFGTLGEAETAADFRRQAAESKLRAESLEVRRSIGKAYFELARLQQEIILTQQHLELSRESEEVALRAYEAGTARFRNVLQAQMESEDLNNRLHSLQDRVVPASANLNTAAGLPVGKSVPVAHLPEIVVLPSENLDLHAVLQKENPSLESLRFQEDSQRHSVEAARLSGRPKFTIGLDYIMTGDAVMPGVDDSGKDPVIARLAINVPLWSGKATARRLASASRLQATSSDRARLGLELAQQLENTIFKVRDAGRNLRLYEDNLLPRARQILQANNADYETGNAIFDELIGARETLLGLELARLRAATDQALALNDLEALLGVPATSFISPEVSASTQENGF